MEAKAPTVSIIIPVYNVEKFLRKCLSSLVEETFQDREIIAVNDGSTDHSLDILREFEQKYDFITVIDQKNRGMSKARNRGLSLARGEYICFIDSDDYVAPNFLERLYNACVENDAQISCCYYYYLFPNSGFTFEYPFRCSGVLTREEAMNKLLRDMQIQSLVWNKMYKRSLFTDYNIQFPSIAFEDMATANRVFAHAERIAVLDEPLCYYVQRSGTLATINASKINDFIRAVAMVCAYLWKRAASSANTAELSRTDAKNNPVLLLVCAPHAHEKKSMRGCLANMRRINRAMRHYTAESFDPLSPQLPDVVCAPTDKKLEKDYSIR
ncbi:MAG: glycosyltransferase [Anaeromassilibacillus sp.]